MTHWICVTCGVQHADSSEPPPRCEICEDERQYVPAEGQRWTTLDELRVGHLADVREEEPGLTGLGCAPDFAIGQRALFVETGEGNVLWDCTTLLDDGLVAAVEVRGGLAAIAISHPHYYSSLVEWSGRSRFRCTSTRTTANGYVAGTRTSCSGAASGRRFPAA